ncbi:MAG: hypothetical protein QG579_278 [Patescibacteria group bacterium]|nr:hypothetical protein [Patescibacteria group bacterium]
MQTVKPSFPMNPEESSYDEVCLFITMEIITNKTKKIPSLFKRAPVSPLKTISLSKKGIWLYKKVAG